MHSDTSTPTRSLATDPFGDARSQHTGLRSRLAGMLSFVARALHEDAHALGRIPSMIDEARAAFEEHHALEEAGVMPFLRAQACHHGEAMLAAHRRQRGLLSALAQEARRAPRVPLLAVKLEFLVQWLLDDMTNEERVWPTIGSA